MRKPVVLVTTPWLLPGGDADRMLIDAGLEVRYSYPADRAASGTALAGELAGAAGLIAGTESFGAEILSGAAGLKVIARTGVGYDNVDVERATASDIAVCATPGVNVRSVAEFTIALVLNASRSIPQNIALVREGVWEQTSGRELHGKVLGVVGLGDIGKMVAQLGHAFGMTVLVHDPYVDAGTAADLGVEPCDLDPLLSRSDFVTLHIPFIAATRHLIDARALGLMKPGAFLINAARGGIVDEDALVTALDSGRIAGAAFDTFAVEPLSPSSPLRQARNLLMTAHIGGATVEGRQRSEAMAAQSVIDVLAGSLPPQTVNAAALRARLAEAADA